MRILGLDVCKDSVVVCTLDDVRPDEPRQFYYEHNFLKLYADTTGLKALLDLKPDVAALEPTGVNYSKLWVSKLSENGVKIALVGHKQLRAYRQNLDLPDKDDQADSLALACYYLEHQNSPRRFVRIRDSVVAEMRDTVLRLHHCARVQSPLINRIRQDLAWQFPEAAKIGLNASLFWGWLAMERKSAKYDRLYSESVGLGLGTDTVEAAKLLAALQRRERSLEVEMRSHLGDVRFLPYRKVFAEFGFGERVEALILSQIYPLENYLVDGKPEVRILRNPATGKSTKRYLSLRKFQKALGAAPTREESGDRKMTKKAGSQLCRTALWQWVFTRLEVKRSRPKNELGKYLGDLLDREKSHKPVKLARGRIAARATAILFKKLVQELK
ncbi:MAG: transposase [Leptolyngbyaceae bacterium]|nr:transposase [Leptolyngbyaceae bacterium]